MSEVKLAIVSLGAGLIFGGLFTGFLSNDFRNQYFASRNLIENCEKELTRTVTCKLIAVLPKGENK